MDVPTYASALTQTPPNYTNLRVLDSQGEEVRGVVEINTEEGWLIRYKNFPEAFLDASGEWPTERIEGDFRLVWIEDPGK